MDHYLNITNDSEGLRLELAAKGEDLFEAKAGRPELLVNRLSTIEIGEKDNTYLVSQSHSVESLKQLTELSDSTTDVSQVFIIRQHHSWATLDISLEMMQNFSHAYNVFTASWKCLFTFGRRAEEGEFKFPAHATRPLFGVSTGFRQTGIESSYILRRAELHGRNLLDGQSPWSIRQTAVYHQCKWNTNSLHRLESSKSTFLLIGPSPYVEDQLLQGFNVGVAYPHAVSPFSVQNILVADSLKGWMRYMAWLEGELNKQSTRMVFTRLGSKESTNLDINVTDSQALKLLDDSVTDLQVILPTLLSTIVSIQQDCQLYCAMNCPDEGSSGDCARLRKQFDQHIKDLETCVQRASVLRDKAASCARLLSDLLYYENAINLRRISEETQLETSSMNKLTETSMKDAAAVKVLTIIGLIYLPTTIVANFFSTQFVQTNEAGIMSISVDAWLLAAIAIPLTVLTVAVWWVWTHGTISLIVKRLLSFRGTHRLKDVELGNLSRQRAQVQDMISRVGPHQTCNSRVASSMTAVSSGEYRKP